MKKILLIEPDRLLAETYRRALETAGYKVSVCAGAQTAVLVADKIQPQLVIAELQLVEHSGIEFLYEFRSYPEWQSIPVLIHTQVPISEFADSWSIMHEQLNVAGYLYKPDTNLHKLIETVNQNLLVTA